METHKLQTFVDRGGSRRLKEILVRAQDIERRTAMAVTLRPRGPNRASDEKAIQQRSNRHDSPSRLGVREPQ